MTKNEKKNLKKETKKMFYDLMDTRDRMFILLDEFKNTHGFIPEEYVNDIKRMNAYGEYKRHGGWRKIPGIEFVINKAIQKFVKKQIQNPEIRKDMTIKEKEVYLKEETKRIYASVARAEIELNKLHNTEGFYKSVKK